MTITIVSLISLVSFITNLFLGMIKVRLKRKSFWWWVTIHASIPIIIPLRIFLDSPQIAIPLYIALAVVGQLIGSFLARKIKKRQHLFK